MFSFTCIFLSVVVVVVVVVVVFLAVSLNLASRIDGGDTSAATKRISWAIGIERNGVIRASVGLRLRTGDASLSSKYGNGEETRLDQPILKLPAGSVRSEGDARRLVELRVGFVWSRERNKN